MLHVAMIRKSRYSNMMAVLLCLSVVAFSCQALSRPSWQQVNRQQQVDGSLQIHRRRRQVLANLGSMIGAVSLPSWALDDDSSGAVNLVTQSDLGVSIRRSVVRAAQVMDRVDGSWEQLSDQFGLGEARKQQEGRPLQKSIPALKALDSELAMKLLAGTDRAVIKSLECSATSLERQVKSVERLVQRAFERSGLTMGSLTSPRTAAELNFLAYCRYKAYIDIFSNQRSVTFPTFKHDLETAVGKLLVTELLPAFKSISNQSRCAQWQHAVHGIEELSSALIDHGFVSAVDPIAVDADSLREWCEEAGELSFTLALDGEATLDAQVLLQEQGFRLYPNFCRHAILDVLNRIERTDVTIDDYFMDTDYNSDPDKFQVKELLLNIVLTSRD